MSTPCYSSNDGKISSPVGYPERRTSLGCSEHGSARRVIFPWLHPSPDAACGDRSLTYHPQQMRASYVCSERPIQNSVAIDGDGRLRPLERSVSFPKDGLGKQQDGDVIKLLPLPKSLEIPKQKQTANPASFTSSSSAIGSKVIERTGLRIRDSICVQKATVPNSAAIDRRYRASPLANNKWVVQSPQINSLSLEKSATHYPKSMYSHRTYYPAASIPQYHEPPNNAKAAPKPLPSILRNKCSGSVGCASRRRSSILCRNSSTYPLSHDGTAAALPPHETIRLSSKCPTLASPSSLRSLNSESGCSDKGEIQHEIGETESDLERITIPTLKVLTRTDTKLRRNASDTVVITSEEELRQRRRRSIHTDDSNACGALGALSDSMTSVDSVVSRHHSLECLLFHKKVSFDPHIWVYEYKDDKPEFERNGNGKWFTEDELAQFKDDAIQRIRQRNMNLISAGSGRVALVPGVNARNLTSSPVPTLSNGNQRPSSSVVFTHPALGLEDEFDPDTSVSKEVMIRDALSREIRNVLLVDPHDAFLVLFTKCLKFIIPHVSVATARSGEEAIAR